MGIYDDDPDVKDVFARYRATLRFRGKIIGGVPRDPKIMEAWLRTKTGLSDRQEELRRLYATTLEEMGANVSLEMTFDELREASEKVAGTVQTNGFKSHPDLGLYIETRQCKAMIKEATNVLFAGERWGPTRKGPRGMVAERAFPAPPDQIPLGVKESDGIELVIGHVTGPQGPRSTLTHYEYVDQPTITFEVLVTRLRDKGEWKDAIDDRQWKTLWVYMQEGGLGALRSQGHGRFDLTGWDRLN